MAIDIIGLMYDSTDPENPVAKLGWHVNADGPIAGADALEVFPETPSRVISGNPPMRCYKFDSKVHFETFMPSVE